MAKVALVLSGCGVFDGSEIHESVLCLLALSEAGHSVHFFAPDREQKKVINHLTHEEKSGERRNILEESARIARGKILPLAKLNVLDFDAIMLPGGFGVALNLSDYESQGTRAHVLPELLNILHDFHKAKKAILATCISPVLLAKAFEGKVELTLTLGSDPKEQDKLDKMKMKGVLKRADEAAYDEENRVYTTPCYMEPPHLPSMLKGIRAIVARI